LRKSDGTPDPASAYVGVITAASPMAPLRIGLASKLATVEPSSSLSHSTDTSAREFGYDGVVAAGTDLVVAAGTDVTVVVVVVVVPPEAVVVVVVVVVVVGILTRQPLRPGPRTPESEGRALGVGKRQLGAFFSFAAPANITSFWLAFAPGRSTANGAREKKRPREPRCTREAESWRR
jgi:hypothetical protein